MKQSTNPSSNPLSTTYAPQETEGRIYQSWIDGGYFPPKVSPSRDPFTIIMPPPNVTGELHIGHALGASIQDAITRWRRMQGYSALWLPGTDHASIATQVVVERRLLADGVDRNQLGREAFLERIWEWVREYGSRITEQHKRLGVSCDWSREKFTMDPGPSSAVRTTFVNLYKKGLIYRGERLSNWCARCGTAISDLEVDHQDVQGNLWYLRYPIKDIGGFVTVATTRPETYLGDTAIAVHPSDQRVQHLIGETVVLPMIGREIPIVSDESVDPEFGTGSVKVTPAHDPNDFEIGQRHGLDLITILNRDVTINNVGGPFEGQDRFEARKTIVAEFERQGLLDKIEAIQHSVGHCQRCGTIVEPMVTLQWWLSVGSHDNQDSIAGRAYAAVKNQNIKIIPERFSRVYLNWMESIRDWCISRQLWWGHRIPVWYCDQCGHQTVALNDPSSCEACDSASISQDQDVLDTWFSSGLWPHSTLGWPDNTDDLQRFYPTNTLVTGYDILFFWVARMIMMGIENTGSDPFKTVYLHGLIRDQHGEKMSKVKENIVNPLDLVDEFGADAVRFALTTGISPGNDSRASTNKLEASRNFANKLWNASRYVLQALEQTSDFTAHIPREQPSEDRWILSRMNRTVSRVGQMMEDFQLGEAQREIYEFLWNEYADWYIELAKIRFRTNNPPSPLPILVHVLETTLRLLHPFMPFVTEELWQNLIHRLPQDTSRPKSIMIAEYPIVDTTLEDTRAEIDLGLIIDIIIAIRNSRAELNIEASRLSEVIIEAGGNKGILDAHADQIGSLARAHPLTILEDKQSVIGPDKARVTVVGATRVIFPLDQTVDASRERPRIESQRDELASVINKLRQRLDDQNFVTKAPLAVVEKERARLTEYQERMNKLEEDLTKLR